MIVWNYEYSSLEEDALAYNMGSPLKGRLWKMTRSSVVMVLTSWSTHWVYHTWLDRRLIMSKVWWAQGSWWQILTLKQLVDVVLLFRYNSFVTNPVLLDNQKTFTRVIGEDRNHPKLLVRLLQWRWVNFQITNLFGALQAKQMQLLQRRQNECPNFRWWRVAHCQNLF